MSIPPSYWRGKQKYKARHEAEEAIARQAAQHLLVRQRGDQHLPETWIDVASRTSCRVSGFYAPGGPSGEYSPGLDGWGVITYNTALTPPRQAKVIIHELVHHLLMSVLPGFVFSDRIQCGYEDDSLDVRHRIAQRVEEICFRRAE